MKAMFKPLGLAAAVAAVTAGYAGVASAQSQAIGQLGDLGIIPYYTVQNDWVTGVHIINSSDLTKVVKLRLRRASDSADALDFNLILSPKDEWTGFIDDSSGNIVFATDDKSCTAPIRADGRFPMPFIFRAGADEGYIEVIGMGDIDVRSPIGFASKHVNGVPRDCNAVASNFFAGTGPQNKGVQNYQQTHQTANATEVQAFIAAGATCLNSSGNVIPAGPPTVGGVCANIFSDSDNTLKVSYFLRDATSGTEIGSNAVHIADFSNNPYMTNQEFGLFSGDVTGFDYPDLDGGPFVFTGGSPLQLRGRYNLLRSPAVLGVSSILNDWSINPALNVQTDWVVTMPGQYTMIDYVTWASSGDPLPDFDNCATADDVTVAGDQSVAACDFRDIPVTASLTLYDREEGEIVPEDGDLVISPAPPGTRNDLIFPYEVNVVQWTDGSQDPLLPSDYATTVDPSVLGNFGWASLSVSSTDDWDQVVCQVHSGTTSWDNFPDLAPNSAQAPLCVSAVGNVPIIGFAAWQRSFPSNPDANYGRLIEHSFSSGSFAP